GQLHRRDPGVLARRRPGPHRGRGGTSHPRPLAAHEGGGSGTAGTRGPLVLGHPGLRPEAVGRRSSLAGASVRHGSPLALPAERRRHLAGLGGLLRRGGPDARATRRWFGGASGCRFLRVHPEALRRQRPGAGWGGPRRVAGDRVTTGTRTATR